MLNIKIEGIVKIEAADGDVLEYPFEARTFNDAIANLGTIERCIEREITEAENRIAEDVEEE